MCPDSYSTRVATCQWIPAASGSIGPSPAAAVDAVTGVSNGQIHVVCSQSGCEAEIRVQDNGCGMDQITLARMFEPFYTTKPQGMGMGLAICRSIVAAHGGRLWATNNADGGATLHCELPAKGD